MPPPREPSQPTITVLGTASVRAEPDEAVLWLRLIARNDSAGDAIADVARRGRQLTALLEAHEIPAPDRGMTGVHVNEEFDHTPQGRRSLGYAASASIVVRATDAELIGQLISRASAEAAAEVDGPHWSISDAHPARLEAARRAAGNARQRGEAYAQGLDATLGPLIHATEHAQSGAPLHRAGKIMPAAASGAMPVEAGELEVRAAIEATFALAP
jgi:uncharacterized protein YggE